MRTWQAVARTAISPCEPLPEMKVATGSLAGTHIEQQLVDSPFIHLLRGLSRQGLSAWRWLEHKRSQQLTSRRLRVAETVSLGEKRFVSILQVDGAQFLIGGAAGAVSVLATLQTPEQQEAGEWRTAGIAGEPR